jgi:hypothetical protein
MGWRMPQRARAPARRREPRRYRRRSIHKPSNLLNRVRETRSEKVQRMIETLTAGQWVFNFTVEAKSPRGFTYCATGKTGEEAFLRAFGQWSAAKRFKNGAER